MLNLLTHGLIDEPTISAESEQVLRGQTITEDGPGTILKDFAALLDFIGEEGLKTTSKNYFLPQSRLAELNGRMSRPVPHRLKRPQQRSFPHLNGLFMILRASGLGTGVGTPPQGRLAIDPQLWDAWRDLNATEQYFTLLESWLVQGSPEIIGEGGGWSPQCLNDLAWVYIALEKGRRIVFDGQPAGYLYIGARLMTLALMELFGWLRFEYADPKEGEGMKLAAIERLEFGDAMESAVRVSCSGNKWPFDEEHTAKPGILQPLFQPYFPEWQETLAQPEWSFREGTYTWRISLGQTWRRIVSTADMCLDALAMAILDAFEFDADHFYCFQLRDARGRKLRIACPYDNDADASTDEVGLGDVPLPEGGVMTFHFDYGDDWKFAVKLEEVSPKVSKLKRPKVTAKEGRPPAQYEW